MFIVLKVRPSLSFVVSLKDGQDPALLFFPDEELEVVIEGIGILILFVVYLEGIKIFTGYFKSFHPKYPSFTMNQGPVARILKSFAQSYPQDGFMKTSF